MEMSVIQCPDGLTGLLCLQGGGVWIQGSSTSVTFSNSNIYQNTAVRARFVNLPRNLFHRPDGLTVTALLVSRHTPIHSSLSRVQ